MSIEDFLTFDKNTIRHSIKDIDESYNNEWDIAAELCQNAVDAIKKTGNFKNTIRLAIDSQKSAIQIYDSGVGIEPQKLPYLLKPFSTDKSSDEEMIGEKGVGLTFVIFSSNKFEIKTGTKNGTTIGKITGAFDWKNSTNTEPLNLEYEQILEDFHGTEVTISEVKDCALFELSFNQIKHVLLTKTALGNTKKIWGDSQKIDIYFEYIDINGNKFSDSFNNTYRLPFDLLPKDSVIDLKEFINFAETADRTDAEKRAMLFDKIIVQKGTFLRNNIREINYISAYVPTRRTWDTLSKAFKLLEESQVNDENWFEKYGYLLVQNCITLSVKGMPTGITIDHPTTGYAGYWANIFILFEDRHAKFDIGRKSIHGRQATIYKDYAKIIFNEYLKYVSKYVAGDPPTDTDWDRDEIFHEIDNILDLNIAGIKLMKSPKDQEASVAALFFECIGNGIIKNIDPVISGYKNRYDLYAKWGNKKIVIEFKSKLKNIMKDFSDQNKMFNQVDCIVCWDVDEDDIETFTNVGIRLEEYHPSVLVGQKEILPNTTHTLTLNYSDPIYIIDLKRMLYELH